MNDFLENASPLALAVAALSVAGAVGAVIGVAAVIAVPYYLSKLDDIDLDELTS